MTTNDNNAICLKKPKISKKLRPNVRINFLKRWQRYSSLLGGNAESIRARQIKGLLINQMYLNESVEYDENILNFEIGVHTINFRSYAGSFRASIVFTWNDYQQIISIIRLSNFKFLRLSLNTYSFNTPTRVSDFIRFCRAIKESIALEKIDLRICRYDNVLVPILSDLLPDKIVHFEGCIRNLRHFMRRNSIMDFFLIVPERPSEKIDYALIFKAKTRMIRIYPRDTLIDLSRYNNLQLNPTIEKIHVDIDFILPDTNKWINEYLPKYRKVFRCLKSVNPKIELLPIKQGYHRGITLNRFIATARRLKYLINDIHSFLDLAAEIEINVTTISINEHFDVIENREEFARIINDLINDVKFQKVDDGEIVEYKYSSKYGTAEIDISVHFQRVDI